MSPKHWYWSSESRGERDVQGGVEALQDRDLDRIGYHAAAPHRHVHPLERPVARRRDVVHGWERVEEGHGHSRVLPYTDGAHAQGHAEAQTRPGSPAPGWP